MFHIHTCAYPEITPVLPIAQCLESHSSNLKPKSWSTAVADLSRYPEEYDLKRGRFLVLALISTSPGPFWYCELTTHPGRIVVNVNFIAWYIHCVGNLRGYMQRELLASPSSRGRIQLLISLVPKRNCPSKNTPVFPSDCTLYHPASRTKTLSPPLISISPIDRNFSVTQCNHNLRDTSQGQ